MVTPKFLEEHDIDFVAHDALPYADASGGDVYDVVRLRNPCTDAPRLQNMCPALMSSTFSGLMLLGSVALTP